MKEEMKMSCLTAKGDPRYNIRLSLNFEISSYKSGIFSDYIADLISKSGIKGHRKALKKALGIIAAGLFEAAAKSSDCFVSKRMARGDFTGMPIGYRPMRNALDGLRKLDLIDFEGGYCPTSSKDPKKAQTSRFRATPAYLSSAKSYGITPHNWMDHYSSGPMAVSVSEPIILRSNSRWIATGWTSHKIAGKDMAFDATEPKVAGIIRQVDEINAFMVGHDIKPAHWFGGFQRIFSQGDIAGFDWNKGGRLYAVEGGYQQRTSDERATMTINGEAVVEIDISASHLTIFHALQGLSIAGDAYDVPGVERSIVKAFVTMTLGKGAFHWRWPDEHKEQYAADKPGRDLQKDFPIGKTRAKIIAHIPALADIAASRLNWADLQYVESKAIIDTVHELATAHGIPALPVHDSLIVPASKREIAAKVLADMFEKHVGIRPVLK